MQTARQAAAEERGGVLVMVALWLPLLVLFLIFVVDVGNWFVHKRHLQMQADAGALAGGAAFGGVMLPSGCNDAAIEGEARKYAGDPNAAGPYNVQIGGTDQQNMHVLVNSTNFWNEGGANYTDGGSPCNAMMVDVKMTEADLPWFFGLDVVPAINARARVQIQSLSYANGGALPIAVPNTDPRRAKAIFVNEETGAVLASAELTKTGFDPSSGLDIWENPPIPVPISASRIGVRIALSGTASSITCGAPLVDCYDAGSSNGILYIRGFSATGTGTATAPIARDVVLVRDTCSDPYFTYESSTCTVGVSAVVDFGVADPATINASVSAKLGNREVSLTYVPGSGRWESTGANFFDVDPADGPLPIELKWRVGSNTGTFGNVQRTFAGSEDRSGPVRLAEVSENGFFWTNSFAQGGTHELAVKIGIVPNLQIASSVNDPIVTLRVVGGSRNQSLDCDPDYSNLYQELAFGCRPRYTVNTGTACASTPTSLWGSPQPWPCVAIQTGSATNQVPRGLNLRVLGDEKPTTCTAPNNWSQYPDIPANDPRILNVFVVPFGAFGGSGSGVIPVVRFATFYITGWTAGGSGFKNPCQGNGDDPVPNGDAGNIVGHFIKYIFTVNDGSGSGQACDPSGFGSCIAVLTE
jgi:hypothetical protein